MPVPDDLGDTKHAGQASAKLVAVLFDMDGTLVDSEPMWGVGLHELARRYGGVLSESARLAMIGTSSLQTMQILQADLGRGELDLVEGADWLDRRMVELFRRGVDWRPGAQSLVAAVRSAGLPTALVTNTSRPLVDAILHTIGAKNFDVIVSADDVSCAKPDPEPYLTAAAALNVAPSSCLAIEDSPSGVGSAVAAGCVVVAIPHDIALTEDQLADPRITVLSSLADLPPHLLAELGLVGVL